MSRYQRWPEGLDADDVRLVENMESVVELKRQVGAEELLMNVIHRLLSELARRDAFEACKETRPPAEIAADQQRIEQARGMLKDFEKEAK